MTILQTSLNKIVREIHMFLKFEDSFVEINFNVKVKLKLSWC